MLEVADDLKRMVTFCVAVDAGSFAAAARRLGVSRAAVSKQIQVLERALGVALLHRSTRVLRMTEAGESIHARCAGMIALATDAVAAAQSLATSPRGVLRVTAPLGVAVYWLAPELAGFCRAHPHLRLELTVDDAYADLLHAPFDLALRAGPMPRSELVARRLAEIELVLCASGRYLRSRRAPRTPAQLADHELVGYAPLGSPMKLPLRSARTGAAVTVSAGGRFTTNNGDVIVRLVRDGFGAALLPRRMVAHLIAAGELEELLPEWRLPSVPVHAVFPRAAPVPAKVRAFVDYLAARLASSPGPA